MTMLDTRKAPMIASTRQVWIGGLGEEPNLGLVYREIVKLATTALSPDYSQDLFYAALWLDQRVSGTPTFYVGVRRTGLDIAVDYEGAYPLSNTKVWRFVVGRGRECDFHVWIDTLVP
jgi:hypothetical protein